MANHFDLIVVGTGSGGSRPAYAARRAGWSVAVVDELPYGGTCALRGCDPKKVLVGAAELADWNRRMQGRGMTGDAGISWPELMRFKRTFTDPVPAQRTARFEKAEIATYHGPARFVGPDTLSTGGEVLEARHFVIAAGAKPRPLGIPGEEHLLTSTEFLDLDELPRRIAFVGAGYISFEFAHVARRAGAEAIIVGRGRPLRHFEPDLVARLVEHTQSLGVEVHTDAEVTAIERHAGYEAAIVASNLLNGNKKTPDYRGIPSVVFTVPPLARVGFTEADARERELDVRVKAEDTSGWYSNRRVADDCAMYKVIVDSRTNRILGAHLLGPHAEEVINLFALAIRSGSPAADLKHLLYAYPTSGSDVPYMIPSCMWIRSGCAPPR